MLISVLKIHRRKVEEGQSTGTRRKLMLGLGQ